MNSPKFSFVIFAAFFSLTALATLAQNNAFSDPNVDYSFALPNAVWKITAKPSAINPNVEYVYGERDDGYLEVRKTTVAKGAMMPDIIRDEEQKRQFLPGFVAGKEENFLGKLRGAVFNFEYVHSGHPMSGRYYFLKANDTTVYMLRFSGEKDSLRTIQNQTDAIARTFFSKQ